MRNAINGLVLSMVVAACGGSSDTGGGSDGGAGTSGSSGSSGSGGAAGSAGSGGSTCTPACGEGRTCCGGQCANTANDPKNCGACGVTCAAGEYCDGSGSCATPPCTATCGSGTVCCGEQCCGTGELCCDPQGPVTTIPGCTPPSEQGTCPMGCAPLCVCASPDTPIATPTGERPIASLRIGDLVYSADRGALKIVPISQIRRVPVRAHRVSRITLSNGSTLELSPRHPTADGRRFEDLRPGDVIDGVGIVRASVTAYAHDATYDILPASDTGTYFAGGVLVGSTLAAPANASR